MLETIGAEIEWGDIDRTRPLPEGFGWDTKEVTIMNSNGVAVDGTGKWWPFGGEILLPPSSCVSELVEHFVAMTKLFPEARLTHRNGVHIHIRIPGLKEDLVLLKSLQRYIHEMLPEVLRVLEPLETPRNASDLVSWHMIRMRRSHQTFLTPKRLKAQLAAKTLEDFFKLEAPLTKDGKPQHHLQPRCAVNLRQLLQTDTIEFRHFYSTLSVAEFAACVTWCKVFIEHWRSNTVKSVLLKEAAAYANVIPKGVPAFSEFREMNFRATAWDGTVDKQQALKTAQEIHLKYPLPYNE